MSDRVRRREDGRVARLELDRPDVKNALDAELCGELRAAFEAVGDGVDVVRLSGRGDSFCSGFDLGELREDVGGMSYESYGRHADAIDDLQSLSRRLRDAGFVVVTEVHGYALGAGCELALISDVAVASETATLGFPETDVGLSITNGATNLLARSIGPHRAKLLTFTGERLSGAEAARLGLVADAVPSDDLGARVDGIVEEILGRSMPAILETKALLNRGAQAPYEESLEREANAGKRLLRSEEYERAISEFFEG